MINEAAGVAGLIWVLVGVSAVLVIIGLCTMLNRHLKQRRCKSLVHSKILLSFYVF